MKHTSIITENGAKWLRAADRSTMPLLARLYPHVSAVWLPSTTVGVALAGLPRVMECAVLILVAGGNRHFAKVFSLS